MLVHINRGSERYGPFSLEEVNAYLANGTLLSTDQAWQDGMTEWIPITQIPGVAKHGGDAVSTSPAALPAARATCPECQSPVEGDQVICMECGKRLKLKDPRQLALSNPAAYTTSEDDLSENDIPSYLGHAIFSTIFALSTVGIVAIIFAIKTRSALAQGNIEQGARFSRLAKVWGWGVFWFGVFKWTTSYIVFLVILNSQKFPPKIFCIFEMGIVAPLLAGLSLVLGVWIASTNEEDPFAECEHNGSLGMVWVVFKCYMVIVISVFCTSLVHINLVRTMFTSSGELNPEADIPFSLPIMFVAVMGGLVKFLFRQETGQGFIAAGVCFFLYYMMFIHYVPVAKLSQIFK